MIEFVLENNIFDFNNRHYKQTDGTAIGSRLGKNYACSYMRTCDRQLFTNTDVIPTLYVRFVDDIFGTWHHGFDARLQFLGQANRIHPNIKVELEWDRQKIAFLDTMVRLENGLIVLGFNDTSTLMGHFVSSPREREKRESRRDEREGQGRKRSRNESEETEEIKTFPLYPYLLQG